MSITEEPVPTVMPARSRSAERPALRIAGVPVRAFKGGLFVLGLVPVARWMVLGLYDRLGANPVEFLIRSAGTWTFVCLLLTLAVTPLRIVTRQHALIHVRRMCGLYTFFYASLHFLMYIWWDQWFDPAAILDDIVSRPFIFPGFSAWLVLVPLALTSTRGWMRRLGRRWQQLHRLIYLAGVLALGHFWLHRAGKNDFLEVYVFGVVLVSLLLWRVARAARRWWSTPDMPVTMFDRGGHV